MCLIADTQNSRKYLAEWPDGEVKTVFKVVELEQNTLCSPYYPDYTGWTPGITKARIGVPYKSLEEVKSYFFQIDEGIHVCMNFDGATNIRNDLLEEYEEQQDDDPYDDGKFVIITLKVSKEDFIGMDNHGCAAFYKATLTEDSYRTGLQGSDCS